MCTLPNPSVAAQLQDAKPNNDKSIKVFYPKPKLHITGPTSIDDFLRVSEYSRKLLSIVRGNDAVYRMESFKINMINTNFSLGVGSDFKVHMGNMHQLLLRTRVKNETLDASYDTRLYAGIKVRYTCEDWSRSCIMIFRSGSILITGPGGRQVRESHQFITDLVVQNIDEVRLKKEDIFDGSSDDDAV